MLKNIVTSLVLATSLTTAGAALAHNHGGHPVTDAKGMSLYTFDKDTADTSNCYGECADNWPPFFAKEGVTIEGLTQITRKDGSLQWAKDGAPLYYWIGDKEPGDTSGDGVGGVWHLAK